jgi:hypothetical protein
MTGVSRSTAHFTFDPRVAALALAALRLNLHLPAPRPKPVQPKQAELLEAA